MAELTALLTSVQQRLSRLEIARETVTAILDETSEHPLTAVMTREAEAPPTASPDAGRPMRAMQVAEAAGLSVDRFNLEGLRSKLKRLVERAS
ncbi:hypothetical protein AB0G67_29135 [Streptomyces sp. NPDC021056]|uniref:hypothetical protein n=1 Tax=Streptomyces sp. NPDC021056 TaxID=3155012 RepID=UPI0033E54A07